MTTSDFRKAMEIAKSDEDLSNENLDIFHGYAFADFKQVFCSLRALARLIRWQCIKFDGSIDSEELDTLVRVGKRKFIVVA